MMSDPVETLGELRRFTNDPFHPPAKTDALDVTQKNYVIFTEIDTKSPLYLSSRQLPDIIQPAFKLAKTSDELGYISSTIVGSVLTYGVSTKFQTKIVVSEPPEEVMSKFGI